MVEHSINCAINKLVNVSPSVGPFRWLALGGDVDACARVCARVCVRACVRACVCVCVCVC